MVIVVDLYLESLNYYQSWESLLELRSCFDNIWLLNHVYIKRISKSYQLEIKYNNP